ATTDYWVEANAPVPVYGIMFQEVGSGHEGEAPLCRDPQEGDKRWDSVKGMAVIFRGDRYRERTKEVIVPPATDPWFNVACAGTSVAKMHLMRHTDASNPSGLYNTTRVQRQALLKMLAGDYCGKGKPFTVDGHPLLYSYDKSWELEADWRTA